MKLLKEAFDKGYTIQNIKGNVLLEKSNKKILVFFLDKNKSTKRQLTDFTKVAMTYRNFAPFVIIQNQKQIKDCIKLSKWHFSFIKEKDLII